MYRCYSPKRFFELLFIDAIIFVLCAVFFCVGKAILKSSADKNDDDSVFLPVIMYHSICERSPSEYIVTPKQAESDLAWLKKNGYTSVSAQELVEYTNGSGILPEKPEIGRAHV